MAGISDEALGKLSNKNKFNGGVEIEEDNGVNLYSTFYRKYDPQIGRFSGVDILSERNLSFSNYQFALNDPISLNDPKGNMQTRTQGDGEESGYLSQWEDIYNTLYYGGGGHYGGKWLPSQNASGGGYSFFSSDADAFMYGSMDMDRNNSWGNDGFATSFQDAQKSYYKNGGTDANVALLAPTIYIHGRYSNGNLIYNKGDFDAQLARNAGMGFGDNNEGSNGWETTAITISKYTDDALTLNGGIIYSSQKLANSLTKTSSKIITKIPVLDVIGDITGVASIAEHSIKFYQNPNWNDGLHVVGQVTALIIGGEFEIGYNLVTLGADTLMDWLDD